MDTRITDFTVTKRDGTIPTGGFYSSDTVMLNIQWDASSYGNQLHEDDYFVLQLPDEFNFPNDPASLHFPVLAPGGTSIVANATVNRGATGGGTVTITFTDYVEDRYDIKGSIHLNATFYTANIVYGESMIAVANGEYTYELPITIHQNIPNPYTDEGIGKFANVYLSEQGHVRWNVTINFNKMDLTNVVISDTLTSADGDMTGIAYVPNMFVLYEVVFDAHAGFAEIIEETNVSEQVVLTDNNTSFTYTKGDIGTKQYRLTYRSTYRPGATLKNEASIDSTEVKATKSVNYSLSGSGGEGSGSLLSRLGIVKVDAGNHQIKLPGAVFRVTRVADHTTFTMTTTDAGEALSEKLIPGEYIIKEVTAPSGYVLNTTEYRVHVASDAATTQQIPNDPEEKSVVVTYPTLKVPLSVRKVLKNGSLQGGEFTFHLKDGQGKIIATASNSADGTVSFPERTFSKPVNNYRYTIQEVPGADADVTYDKTVYTVSVTTKAVDGKLQANVAVERDGIPYAGTMTFTNQRAMPGTGDNIYYVLTLLSLSMLLLAGAYVLHRRRGRAS